MSQDQKKIALLQEYVECLQRENFAKNGQTTLVYKTLHSLRDENDMLKSYIETMIVNWEEERNELNDQIKKSMIEKQISRDFTQQLRASVDMRSLQTVAEDIKKELESKQALVDQLYFQNQQLQILVSSLREQLTSNTKKMLKSEEELRSQMKITKQLQNEIFTLKNNRSENRTAISFAKLESDKLAKQKHQMFEKVKNIDHSKPILNNVSRQTSPIKPIIRESEHGSVFKRNKSKKQRWGVMQQKWRSVKQNEQLKSNLSAF